MPRALPSSETLPMQARSCSGKFLHCGKPSARYPMCVPRANRLPRWTGLGKKALGNDDGSKAAMPPALRPLLANGGLTPVGANLASERAAPRKGARWPRTPRPAGAILAHLAQMGEAQENHAYLPFPPAPDGASLRGGGGQPPAFRDGPQCPLPTQSTPPLGPCPMRRLAIGWIVSRPPPGGPICG